MSANLCPFASLMVPFEQVNLNLVLVLVNSLYLTRVMLLPTMLCAAPESTTQLPAMVLGSMYRVRHGIIKG